MRRFALSAALTTALVLGTVAVRSLGAAPATALSNCEVDDYSIDSEELEFLRIINEYRVENGRGPLTLSANLSRAAEWMARDMGEQSYFGHIDSLGRDPWVRIVDCGYPVAGGENLAAGTYRSTAASAFELFRNSPSHDENMLLDRYVQIGIARVYIPGSQYGWYWATTFGTLDDGSESVAFAATSAPANAPAMARHAAELFSIETGANFVTWTGGEVSPDRLFGGESRELVLYRWDSLRRSWLRYGPGLPAFLQSLHRLRPGDGIWVVRANASAGN